MALSPPVVDVAPGELITSQHVNNIKANLNRLDGVDAGINAAKVAKAGDVMTGTLRFGNDPATGTGSQLRSDGAINNTFFADDSAMTVTSSNLTLTRAKTPVADAGGIFTSYRRSGGTVASAVQIGSVTIGAGGTGVLFNTTSDPRTKVREADITDAAERVKQLGAAAFRGRRLNLDGPEPVPVGDVADLMMAPDIAAVAPYAVTGSEGAVDPAGNPSFMQVDYGALVPLLTAALADALTRIEHLEQAAG
jgi:hypothetical protein